MVTQEIEAPVAAFSQEENDALIDEMLRGSKAPEPGDFMQDRVVSRGDDGFPVPIVADTLISAGHVYVWDTKSGEQSVVNRNMLALQLSKKHPDGSRAFTLTKPAIEPPRGTMLCLLHANAPNRAEYDRMGFKVCPKANLMTESDVEWHMKARHKREWATIQAEKTRQEKAEDRTFQREMMKTMAATVKATRQQRERKPKTE